MGNQAKTLLEDTIVKGQPIQLRQTIEMQFAEGALDSLKSQKEQIKLTESAGGTTEKRKLRVTVEGIHTGMTKNLTFYPGNALEESTPTWTTPHRKPVLKNHSSYSEPLGRIVSADYVESTIVADRYTVRQTLELTDEDAIDKVLDGRYLTLSVGGSANKVNCSVCARDIIESGFCGHYRGRKYEGKTAHWIIGQYTGDEISFVNMPADVHSQVIAAELVSGEGGKNMSGKAKGNESAAGSTSVNESTEDLIDNLLNEENQEDDAEKDPGHQQEGSNDNSDNDNSVNEEDESEDGKLAEDNEDDDDSVNSDNDDDKVGDESVSELQRQLEEANEKITSLEQKLEESEADNLVLSGDLSESKEQTSNLEQKLQTVSESLQAAEDEKKTFESQNIKLAQFARKALAERVVDLRIMHGKDTLENRASALSEWTGCTSKILQSQIDDLVKTPRTIASVTSPGMVYDANDVEDEEGNRISESQARTGNSDAPLTFADMEKRMVSTMSRTF